MRMRRMRRRRRWSRIFNVGRVVVMKSPHAMVCRWWMTSTPSRLPSVMSRC